MLNKEKPKERKEGQSKRTAILMGLPFLLIFAFWPFSVKASVFSDLKQNFSEGRATLSQALGVFQAKAASLKPDIKLSAVTQPAVAIGQGYKTGVETVGTDVVLASNSFTSGLGNFGHSVVQIGQKTSQGLQNFNSNLSSDIKTGLKNIDTSVSSLRQSAVELGQGYKAGANAIGSDVVLASNSFTSSLGNFGQSVVQIGQKTSQGLQDFNSRLSSDIKAGLKGIDSSASSVSKSMIDGVRNLTDKIGLTSPKEELAVAPVVLPPTSASAGAITVGPSPAVVIPAKAGIQSVGHSTPLAIYSNSSNQAIAKSLGTVAPAPTVSANPPPASLREALRAGLSSTGVITIQDLKVIGTIDLTGAVVKGFQQTVVNNNYYSTPSTPTLTVYNTTTKENENWQVMTGNIGGVSTHFSVGKDLTVGQNATVASILTIGSATSNGSLVVNGNSTITGATSITGAATLSGDLIANGSATLGDSSGDIITINGRLSTLTISDGSTTSSLAKNSFFLGDTASNSRGIFYVDSSGNVSASGTLGIFGATTLGGHLYTATDNLYDVGTSSTQWRYGNFQGGLLVANGTTTSTFDNTKLIIAQNSSANLGKFYVDGATGNVSASGSLYTYGNVTSTGILYATTGLISSASSTFASNLMVAGALNTSSTLQSTGNLTIYGDSTLGDSSGDTITINGRLSTLNVSDGSTTSSLAKNSFYLGDTANNGRGVFYIDASGNVSSSGTLSVFGNLSKINTVAYTWPSSQGANGTALKNDGSGNLSWGIVGTNDWGRFSSTFGASALMTSTTYPVWFDGAVYASSTVKIAGAGAYLDVGGTGGGLSEVYINASSTTAIPLVIRGSTGGAGTTYDYLTKWQDSVGNTIGFVASSTDAYTLPSMPGNPQTYANSSLLTLGRQGVNAGVLELRGGDSTSGKDGSIVIWGKSGYVEGFLFSDRLDLSKNSVTSTLTDNTLILGAATNYTKGVFYVNSSGNVSASGSLYTYGNVTSTGIIYGTNGLISSASSTFSNDLYIAGNLDIGAEGSGLSQLYLKASTTTAIPLVIRGSTGGAGTTYDYLTKWQDSVGNTIGFVASSTDAYTVPLLPGNPLTYANSSLLTLGRQGVNAGVLELKAGGSTNGTIVLWNSSGRVEAFLSTGRLDLSKSSVTSTLQESTFILGAATGYTKGIFYVDSSGNVSASGTLTTFGNTTLGGHLYPSTDNLYDLGASSTQWRYGNFQGGLLVADGSTTGTLLNNALTLGQTSGSNLGKFYIDSSGNVSASGSLYTYGNVTSTGILYATNGIMADVATGYNQGKFYVDTLGNISATGTLTVWGGVNTTSTIVSSTQFLFSKGSNYNMGTFNVTQGGNVSASGTLSINGLSDGSVTSTILTSFNVGADSFIYDASSTLTYITSLQTGNLNFVDDAGVINWVNLNITTTTASIANSYSAAINDYPVLTVYGLSNTAGTASNLGLMVASSSAPWTDFSVNNLFTVASSTGNTNASGTLRVWGGASTGGLLISATNSTTTLTSYVTDGVGAGAFVLNANAGITSTTAGTNLDRVLLAVQSNGTNKFLVSGGGNVYATAGFNANSTQYGIGDVAEYVNIVPGESVEPGDVVIADLSGINKYKKSTEAYAKNVAGVISDTGAFIIGASGENRAALALAGLVRVKVTDENGSIAVGDYLVTASQSGYAMKYDPATGKPAGLVGMALEPWDPPAGGGKGKIMLMVNKGFVDGASQSVTNLTVNEDANGQLVQSADLNLAGYSILNVKGIVSANGSWLIDENGSLMAKEIKADKIQAKKFSVEKNTESNQSTVGEAIIKINTTSVVVENDMVSSTSKIFITFRNNPKAFWWISKQIDGQFEISLSQAASEDVVFDYWLVGVEESVVEPTPVVEPPPAEAAAPTVETPAPVVETPPTPPASQAGGQAAEMPPVVETPAPVVETPPAEVTPPPAETPPAETPPVEQPPAEVIPPAEVAPPAEIAP